MTEVPARALLTVKQAADRCGVSVQAVIKHIKSGTLPFWVAASPHKNGPQTLKVVDSAHIEALRDTGRLGGRPYGKRLRRTRTNGHQAQRRTTRKIRTSPVSRPD